MATYDPELEVMWWIAELADLGAHALGQTILDYLDTSDPLRCRFDDNVDEYLGYAKRIVCRILAAPRRKRARGRDARAIVKRSFAAETNLWQGNPPVPEEIVELVRELARCEIRSWS